MARSATMGREATKLLRPEYAANPSPTNPMSIIAHVEGSGTALPVSENTSCDRTNPGKEDGM